MAKRESPSVPVTLSEWREYLRSYSADYLRVATEEELARFDDVQRENRWLGYEPADEEAVRAAEERIGVRLPPSYRNFLLVSNGWRRIDPLLNELLKVDEIDWLPEVDPELWDIWSSGEDAEQLKRSVLLSGHADGDYWLLDAGTVGPDGEWTACLWMASSGLEPEPHPSFGALVVSARELFEHGRPIHPNGGG
jgi:SMI1-KNR4 cell-wall